jgi:hypothetical protein
MPVASLTMNAIDAFQCPIDKDRTVLWDKKLPGFGIVAYRSGKKAFVAQFRDGGRSRRVTIGGWPSTPLGVARAAARKMLSDARLKSQDARRAEGERTRLERPVAGFGEFVSVRLPKKTLKAIDGVAAEYAHVAPDGLSRSGAIRMLLDTALRLHKGGHLPGGMRVRVEVADERDVERRKTPDRKQDAKRTADKYVSRDGKPR